ncbi:MAG: hypothetical protein DRJ67_07330 [Thermoprotei archaeon]|nr:MAG: hypothetical protein DRJ67_07330 [Thermoprotei archaeon]
MSSYLAAAQMFYYLSLRREARERRERRGARELRKRLRRDDRGITVYEVAREVEPVEFAAIDAGDTLLWLPEPGRQLRWMQIREAEAEEPRVALTGEDIVSGKYVEYLRRLAERVTGRGGGGG